MGAGLSIAMLGATGAVGTEVVRCLRGMPELDRLILLGRRKVEGLGAEAIRQHTVDVLDPASYAGLIDGARTAICTLGVGQPSTMSKADFVRIDRDAVLDFAAESKRAGVRHFELLSSVGARSSARLFYLRTKGELHDGLEALGFERLSLFEPSMILTERNRYGFLQGLTLRFWPLLGGLMPGPLRKYRGIEVARLGRAIARNATTAGEGVEHLTWDDFQGLV